MNVEILAEDTDKHRPKEENHLDTNTEKRGSEYGNQEKIDDKNTNKDSSTGEGGNMNLELVEIDVHVEKLAEETDKHRPKEESQLDTNTEKKSSEYENQEKVDVINAEQLAENTGPKEETI